MTFFDIAEGERLKTEGMQAASSWPFDQPVARARNIAIMLAKRQGTVCADDVYAYLAERLPDVLNALQPAAWGSVTKSPKLRATGQYTKSKRIPRHTGTQMIWEYSA